MCDNICLSPRTLPIVDIRDDQLIHALQLLHVHAIPCLLDTNQHAWPTATHVHHAQTYCLWSPWSVSYCIISHKCPSTLAYIATICGRFSYSLFKMRTICFSLSAMCGQYFYFSLKNASVQLLYIPMCLLFILCNNAIPIFRALPKIASNIFIICDNAPKYFIPLRPPRAANSHIHITHESRMSYILNILIFPYQIACTHQKYKIRLFSYFYVRLSNDM